MQKPQPLPCIALIAVALAFSLPAKADTTIIYDSFSESDSDISSHTPDVDLFDSTATWAPDNHSARGNVYDNGSAAVSYDSNLAGLAITSTGSYTAPTGEVSVSADIEIGSLTGVPYSVGASPANGILLGFVVGPLQSPGQGPGNSNLAGILIATNGDVYANASLTNEYAQRDLTLLGSAPTGWTSSGSYELSYNVNLTTGLLSDVVFDGQSYAVPGTVGDIFTHGAYGTSTPTEVGFATAGDYYTGPGYIDNLTLSVPSVPEPSSLALMVAGLVTAGFVLRRRLADR